MSLFIIAFLLIPKTLFATFMGGTLSYCGMLGNEMLLSEDRVVGGCRLDYGAGKRSREEKHVDDVERVLKKMKKEEKFPFLNQYGASEEDKEILFRELTKGVKGIKKELATSGKDIMTKEISITKDRKARVLITKNGDILFDPFSFGLNKQIEIFKKAIADSKTEEQKKKYKDSFQSLLKRHGLTYASGGQKLAMSLKGVDGKDFVALVPRTDLSEDELSEVEESIKGAPESEKSMYRDIAIEAKMAEKKQVSAEAIEVEREVFRSIGDGSNNNLLTAHFRDLNLTASAKGLGLGDSEEEAPMIIVDRVDSDLEKFLKDKENLSETEKTKIAFDSSTALKVLHEKNVIHGDLKAGNLLLSGAESVKLSDFDTSTPRKEMVKKIFSFGNHNWKVPQEGTVINIPPELKNFDEEARLQKKMRDDFGLTGVKLDGKAFEENEKNGRPNKELAKQFDQTISMNEQIYNKSDVYQWAKMMLESFFPEKKKDFPWFNLEGQQVTNDELANAKKAYEEQGPFKRDSLLGIINWAGNPSFDSRPASRELSAAMKEFVAKKCSGI